MQETHGLESQLRDMKEDVAKSRKLFDEYVKRQKGEQHALEQEISRLQGIKADLERSRKDLDKDINTLNKVYSDTDKKIQARILELDGQMHSKEVAVANQIARLQKNLADQEANADQKSKQIQANIKA